MLIDMASDLGESKHSRGVRPSEHDTKRGPFEAVWQIQLAVLQSWVTPPIAALAAGYLIYSDRHGVPLAVLTGLGAGLVYAAVSRWAKRLAATQNAADESRRRVLEAERELEDALRPAPTVTGRYDREHWTLGDDELMHADVPLPPLSPTRTPLGLPELWKVTHSRLDHYHETVLGQAQRSFRSAQLAMWIGFLLLGGFVWVAVKASTTTGAIVAGGLGAVSAALAGYVSRTFVKSQETAASHLRAYFDQPLMFSRFLAAERLLQDGSMDEAKRAEALSALVLAMAVDPKASLGEEKPTSPPA
ncbi:hypothetical protein ABZ439_06745 [Streptomyces sp. NPDC005840]|uniref:hypothetical protein n=1 Tax=Streptomyces sp. NPDC005840 TaxID=3157072 RepID=UPI0033C49A99